MATTSVDRSDLEFLPPPEELGQNCRFFAALDAIFEPEWQYRYYSFDLNWGPTTSMASLRSGSGDHWHAVFGPELAFIKGFTLDASGRAGPQGWPLEQFARLVPRSLHPHLREPAFHVDETGFCLWWDGRWRGAVRSNGPVERHLARLQDVAGGGTRYASWAREYYEIDVDEANALLLWRGEPLTRSMVAKLNPESDIQSLQEDFQSLGLSLVD